MVKSTSKKQSRARLAQKLSAAKKASASSILNVPLSEVAKYGFSQETISMTSGRRTSHSSQTVIDLAMKILFNKGIVNQIPPIRVMISADGIHVKSCDNRRLCSFKLVAGLPQHIKTFFFGGGLHAEPRVQVVKVAACPLDKDSHKSARTEMAFGKQSVIVSGMKLTCPEGLATQFQDEANREITRRQDEKSARKLAQPTQSAPSPQEAYDPRSQTRFQDLDRSDSEAESVTEPPRRELASGSQQLPISESGRESVKGMSKKTEGRLLAEARSKAQKKHITGEFNGMNKKTEGRLLAEARSKAQKKHITGEFNAIVYNAFIDAVRESEKGGEMVEAMIRDVLAPSRKRHPEFWEGDMVSIKKLNAFWTDFCEHEPRRNVILLAHLSITHEASPWLSHIIRFVRGIQTGGGLPRDKFSLAKSSLAKLHRIEELADEFDSKARLEGHVPPFPFASSLRDMTDAAKRMTAIPIFIHFVWLHEQREIVSQYLRRNR